MASRVCSMNAATSEPMNISPSPTPTTCGDDRVRLVGVGEDQREVALEPAHDREHGGREVARGVAFVVLPGDQVNRDLGVGIAGELDTGGFQLGGPCRVVLDDPVVDDRDLLFGVA